MYAYKTYRYKYTYIYVRIYVHAWVQCMRACGWCILVCIMFWFGGQILHCIMFWCAEQIFHRFGITAYDDIWVLHIVWFGNRVCLVSAEITFDFVFFRCTHFKGAIKQLLNSESNQKKNSEMSFTFVLICA